METPQAWRLDWDESLSVFIPEIDSEHKRFIRLVNELNKTIVDRLDTAVLQNKLQNILDDAAEHFAHEEALFKALLYPNAEEHMLIHTSIIQALRATMDQLGTGSTSYEWVAAGLKIKALLIEHLLNEDMKYRDFCLASGNQSKASIG